jgi:hypothetical protein
MASDGITEIARAVDHPEERDEALDRDAQCQQGRAQDHGHGAAAGSEHGEEVLGRHQTSGLAAPAVAVNPAPC